MLLQWHITERCDHACSHCYQEGTVTELSIEQLFCILEQFRSLRAHLRKLSPQRRIPAHITVTGGEPFLRDDFFDLLKKFHALHTEFSYAILASGSRIDASVARQLAALKPGFVQVSLEGRPETHDAIRGSGDYARVISAISSLKDAGVPVMISFTAHKNNYREFPDVAETGRKMGVQRVWADRFVPLGGAAGQRDRVLSPADTDEFLALMSQARNRRGLLRRCSETTSMLRALQFHKGNGRPYRCQAGKELITVMADGILVPCRRMPIPVGNLLLQNMSELYFDTPLFRELREERIPDGCVSCFYHKECNGGLRCLSFAMTGTFHSSDPGCSRAGR